MNLSEHYKLVMTESVNMALATSTDNRPNVRVVTFAYDEAREGRLFFSTFRGNQKIAEFAQNPQVACMPLPLGPEAGVQVRIFGKVQQSALTMDELIELIGRKASGDADTMSEGGDLLEIYEVRFTEAWVTVGMTDAQCYRIDG